MNKNRVAFILALIAGALCLSKFIYSYLKTGEVDWPILLAGIFILAIGWSRSALKP